MDTIPPRTGPGLSPLLSSADELSEKDTGGRLFGSEYFHADEVNRKLMHVLGDTPESAHLLLTSLGGLTGTLRAGWFGPLIKAGMKPTRERLGALLSMLEDEVGDDQGGAEGCSEEVGGQCISAPPASAVCLLRGSGVFVPCWQAVQYARCNLLLQRPL